jgi:hypothetical protein
MVLMAFGFALVNAPATSVSMSTLRPDQVGAGAIVNETSRELGSTLGVAVVGSVFASVFAPHTRTLLGPFRTHGLSATALSQATGSMQGAAAVVHHIPQPTRTSLQHDVVAIFMDSFHRGCFVAGCTALVVGFAMIFVLPSGPLADISHG